MALLALSFGEASSSAAAQHGQRAMKQNEANGIQTVSGKSEAHHNTPV
jgi:hypothetical protein